MILTVPQDETLYPSLGPQVCEFIEQNLVFGPGDLRGKPAVVDDETAALIYRFYEVYPRGHPLAGRRRFPRCAISLAKGTAKTEKAAWISACELHPDAPVRFTGWTPSGEPIGGPVTDPYIALVAYTEEQSDDLAYTALKVIIEEGPLKYDFDVGLDRIKRLKGDGIAQSLSGSPAARDGARTTFQHFDETHRFTLQRLLDTFKTMVANTAKRRNAWSLETTTAFEPGAGSVAELTMQYARSVADGLMEDAGLFFFHRQAGDEHDLSTLEGFRAAVTEALGPTSVWRDVETIVSLRKDPTADHAYQDRVYCNRLVKGSTQAFDVIAWKKLEQPESPVKPGDPIALGFDGAQFHDGTGIVATHIETGYQWVAGVWECPPDGEKRTPPWQVPTQDVDALVHQLFAEFNIWRLYADPPYWQSWIAKWIGEFGKDRVIEWWTNRRKPMTAALENYDTAMKEGRLSHDGDKRMQRHLGNSRRLDLGQRDEQGKALWLIQKERPDSPQKIDLAMAGCLSWECRTDGIAAGALKGPPQFQMLFVGKSR